MDYDSNQTMIMSNNKAHGDCGEGEIIRLVRCPNCGKKLNKLPVNYPLYDVQCTGCSFRAQIKTSLSKPKDVVRGAGWDVIEKVTKCGFIIPPLIVNFKWAEGKTRKQSVRFYPFIPKKNLRNYKLSPQARQPNYRMFDYIGLIKLPHFTLYTR